MKSIKRPKKKKKLLLLSLAALLVLVGGYLTFAAANKLPPFPGEDNTSRVDYNPPTEEQKQSGDEAAEETKTGENNDPEPSKPPIDGNQSENAAQAHKAGVQITAANQNGNQLQVRAMIQTVNPGTCSLKLSKSGQSTVTRSAGTQALSNSSACKGFDIPTSELAPGVWQLVITFKGAGTEGSASRQVTIK